MEEAEIPLDPPDGITDPVDRAQFWDRHASPISFLILGSLVAAAVTGHFGGQPSPRVDADFGLARLSVLTPTVIRNGEFFETAIDIRADEPLTDATLAVEAGLWRDMTINTMIPAAAEEEYKNGEYRFSYGPLEAGETLSVKIDGQINPPLFAGNEGVIAVYDGERLLGRQVFRIKVLP
ncbi:MULTISPECIES: hypothetical protein [unclassified Sphingopyxis]|jgi:hypothetical protein|uniref:hypothetical protein n=1 Tax=unclassified Sphingopyxis TaxID=2614943 RepID=UPI001AD36769|nr:MULTISPECIES: hypothetical protein [unclassified Sphingopyxis]MBN8841708.1 hypothetical protein [Sphingomonadales bacterium]MDR6834188.1 hypothetical protein [Sphingopyxis sp. BE122]MDR7226458.1 hypothetical protein [Sphingopyxis sp. BE259]HEV7311888.1 hypothetical protein [Sphingopyxis sp.]